MSDAPAVSIAIRAFRRRFVGEAIASVLGQTFRDLELVVYDDAGDLEDVAASFADERVRYHLGRERLGGSGRFLAAVALCRGRYLGILDDDDRYEPRFVERLVAELEADPGAGAAACRVLWEKDGRVFAPADGRMPGVQNDALRAFLKQRWIVTPSAFLLRRSLLDELESRWPMPDGVATDLFVNVRTTVGGAHFTLVGEPLVVKRWHDEQDSRAGLVAHDRIVATWRALPLPGDSELERIRRAQLARSLVRRAGYRLLLERDGPGARADLREARAAEPGMWRGRRSAVGVAARVPRLGAAGMRVWLALPPVRRRRERPPGRRLHTSGNVA